VFDTPTWRATSASVIQDPGVQKEVSRYLVNEIYSSPKVRADINDALPSALKPFSTEIRNGMQQVSQAAAERLLQTSQAQKLWVDASTQAHAEMVKLIENKGAYVKSNNGKVVLDLHAVLLKVAADAGISSFATRVIPPNAGKINVIDSNQLSTVQTVARILHIVAIWLPLLTVALFALAVWLARGFRRRALLWSAIGILIATIILVFVRRELGTQIVDSLVTDVTVRPALITAWYIGTDVLGTINWTLFIIAAVLGAGLWLAGQGRISTRVRTRLAPWIVDPYYAFGVPAALLLILIVWGPLPVFQKFIPVLIIAVLSAIGIEALRRFTIAEQGTTPTA
jgi:hypothetical protein